MTRSVFFALADFMQSKSINVSVDYADYAVCQAVMAVIDEWVQSLPMWKKSGFYSILKKTEEPAKLWLDRVCFALIAWVGSRSFAHTETVQTGLSRTLFWLAVGLIVFVLTDVLTYLFFNVAKGVRPKNQILIIQGDRDRALEIDARRGRIRWLMSILFIGIIGTVSLGVASNDLFAWLNT